MKRSFDVVMAADLRFPGGTSTAVADEIRVLHAAGRSIGLVQMDAPIFGAQPHPVHPRLAELLEAGKATRLEEHDVVDAPLLLIHHPMVLAGEPRRPLPVVRAARRVIIAHHAPLDARDRPYYDCRRLERVGARLFGGPLIWAPISAASRGRFEAAPWPLLVLRRDWRNVVFCDEWGAPRASPQGARPVLGRHSRPGAEKWPATASDILRVYPDDPRFDVRILGVGEAARARLGRIPSTWTTYEFNQRGVREFLSELDFFVYFHHPTLVESFGRAIAEAIAAGCVAILPPYLKASFGAAALYTEPAGVRNEVLRLFADHPAFARQSQLGRQLIDREYGPAHKLETLRWLEAAATTDEVAERQPRRLRRRIAVEAHLLAQRGKAMRRRGRRLWTSLERYVRTRLR